MMLSLVSRPSSFMAKERPGAGESKCLPPPADMTKPAAALMLVSSPGAADPRNRSGLRGFV
jgi:hypothetical protein